jgi:hypothetical protein
MNEDAWIEYRDKGLYSAGILEQSFFLFNTFISILQFLIVLEQSMGARKGVRIGFVYRPASAEILKQSLARNE